MGSTDTIPRGPVEATLNFSVGPEAGETKFYYVDKPPQGEPPNNLKTDPRKVLIQDIRGFESNFTLDKDAFQFLRGLSPSAENSFTDDESIKKNYYPEVEKLLLDTVPGANRIVIFDHTVRRPVNANLAPASGLGSLASKSRTPVYTVHIDQTAYSTALRVRRHVPERDEVGEAERLLASSRYRIINVWRTLNAGPIESEPLAFASSATLAPGDTFPVELRYPPEMGYTGETAGVVYSPGQQWYYASGMTADERLLLECFDSATLKGPSSGVDGGRVPHTAFADPRTRPGAEGRSSIEIRALVFGR